jgi:hypothetical protein
MFVALDPRETQQATVTPTVVGFNFGPGLGTALSELQVPPMTSSIAVDQTSTSPSSFELEGPGGTPLITPEGDMPYVTASTSPDAPSVLFQPPTPLETGYWEVAPDLIGPFANPTTPKDTHDAISITTLAFDPTVTANVYDVAKLETIGKSKKDFFGRYTPAGAHLRIAVAIRPDAPKGTVVQGTLLVEGVDENTGTISLLAALPYEYVAP